MGGTPAGPGKEIDEKKIPGSGGKTAFWYGQQRQIHGGAVSVGGHTIEWTALDIP